MPVYNISLNLTPKEALLVQSGKANLMGLIKDANTSRIVRHVPTAVTTKETSPNAAKYALIGIGIAAAVAATTAVAYAVAKHIKKKKAMKENPALALSIEYNQAMVNYVEKAQKGKLSLKDVKRFADFFNAIVEDYKTGDIKIDLSIEEINTLYGIVYKFTKALCEKSKEMLDVKYQEIDFTSEVEKEVKVEFIRDMLNVQQQIYA